MSNENRAGRGLTWRNLDGCPAWARLMETAGELPELAAMLSPERLRDWTVSFGPWEYSYGAKRADERVLDLLQGLADEQQLTEKYTALLAGERINTGEDRRVLHHLTRGEQAGPVTEEGRDLGAFYREQRDRIADFARRVRSGEITGSTGKAFTAVVQIGIGGSDLGPRALYLALENRPAGGDGGDGEKRLEARFISNVDPDDANGVLRGIDYERTLFILVSKSGTTQETLANRNFVLEKMAAAGVKGLDPAQHMVAVTSQTSPLAGSEDVLDSFYIDDYIGGRYSSSSAVGGTVLSLALGPDVFAEFLDGAAEADRAAREPDIRKNAALLDALLGVYERNALGFPSTAVLPYSQALSRFPAHLQQLDMESNGKQVNRRGEPVGYATGPVIFGEPGTNGQHSFYQLLHQGTDVVPLQFVGFRRAQTELDLEYEGSTSQEKLKANLAAQVVAFARGQGNENPNKRFPGGRPSSLLTAEELTPRALGALLAHYENKVMFQGFVWNVNSFDQEGVQLGKILTKTVLAGEMDPVLQAAAEKLGL